MGTVEVVLWLALAAGWFGLALAYPRLRRGASARLARRESGDKQQDPTTQALLRTIEVGLRMFLFLLGLSALLPLIEVVWNIPRQSRLDLTRMLSQARLFLLFGCGLAALVVERRR